MLFRTVRGLYYICLLSQTLLFCYSYFWECVVWFFMFLFCAVCSVSRFLYENLIKPRGLENKFSFLSPHVSQEDKQGQQIADILLTHKFKKKLIFASVNLRWVFSTKHHSRWLNLKMWFFNCNWNICKLWWMQAKSLGVACHQSRSWDDILYGFIAGGTS